MHTINIPVSMVTAVNCAYALRDTPILQIIEVPNIGGPENRSSTVVPNSRSIIFTVLRRLTLNLKNYAPQNLESGIVYFRYCKYNFFLTNLALYDNQFTVAFSAKQFVRIHTTYC